MKRLLAIALLSSLASLPLVAQRGGGGSHSGGSGGHAGGSSFSGGGSRGSSGSGMASRPSGGGQRFSAPSGGARSAYPSSAHYYGGGYRSGYGYAGARPAYSGNRQGGLRYPVRNPTHQPGQPYRGPYRSGYGNGYGSGYGYGLNGFAYGGWIGSDYLGYPDSLNYDNSNDGYDYGAAGYPPSDDPNAGGTAYGAGPDDQSGYPSGDQPRNQSGYGASADEDGLQPPPPPAGYEPGYGSGSQSGNGIEGRPAAPVVNERAEDLRAAEPITLIYKDGRKPEQVHDYILSRATLTVLDRPRRVIPVDQLDLQATVKANRAAGVEFHLPRLAQ